MDSKSIRRLSILISGLASAVVAVFLLFYLDIVLKIKVGWLLGISVTGLVGGALLLVASTNIQDEDNILSRVLAIIGALLLCLFDVVLVEAYQDTALMEYAKYNLSFVIIFYTCFGISLISTCGGIFGSSFEVIE